MEAVLKFTKPRKPDGINDQELRGQALFKVVFGIGEKWGLDQGELADLLGKSPSVISDWKKKKSIPTSKKPSLEDYQIFEFIELYKTLSSIFAFAKDGAAWLRNKNEALGDQSPLEIVKEDPRALSSLRELMNRLANP